MKLPHAQNAVVERRKVVQYLLCLTHPDGSAKARFFMAFGFAPARWRELAEALRAHGAANDVSRVMESPFGTRYNVDGPLLTPCGRAPSVRSVWIVDASHRHPRLVTAHPIWED